MRFWSGHYENTKSAKISWSNVCLPKKEGGLGLKRIEEWNKACIARLIWLLSLETDSLWVAWIYQYYFRGKSL